MIDSDELGAIYREYEHAGGNELVEWLCDTHDSELSGLVERYPDKCVFEIEWPELWRFDSELADAAEKQPEPYRELLMWVVEEALSDLPVALHDDLDGSLADVVAIRFADVGEPAHVTELIRGDRESELVTLRGQVAKASATKPRVTMAALVCDSCNTPNEIRQPAHGTNVPNTCGTTDCRGSHFTLDYSSSRTEYHQLVRVKEPAESESSDQHIDVHLTKDAAGVVNGGERVDITGVLKAHVDDFRDSATPDFYLKGETVRKHESDYDEINTSEYANEIKAIANGERGNPYELLTASFAHSMRGDDKLDTIKLALVLQLFGGWRRSYGDGRYARGDMHMALIGDPGTGKSSLLNAAEDISPRSTFVSGKNASKAGMTAAAVRDDFGDTEWSLEAGAVVKAHRGIACVDEIDKVNPDVVSSLHTALEKQRLEVSKAGIEATLKCETSLLAAGNPSDGRFIDEVNRIQQINLPPALRSRFDLIFALESTRDSKHDQALAEHMTELRSVSGKVARGEQGVEERKPPIERDVLRAYVAYAKEHSYPVVESDSVKQKIADVYNRWRGEDNDVGGLTPRLIDATNRLAEASARVRLDDTVREEDVVRAERIIEQSLRDLDILDRHGDLDVNIADMLETGTTNDERMSTKDIPGIIETLMPTETSLVSISEVVDAAEHAGYTEHEVNQRIKELCHNSLATREGTENKVRVL